MKLPCALALLLAAVVYAEPEEDEDSATYQVTAVAKGDTLAVRSDAGASFDPVAQLANGTRGLKILGPPVMNGKDDWVPIRYPGGEGWVRPKYLQREKHRLSQAAGDVPSGDLESWSALVTPSERTVEVWRAYSSLREASRDQERSAEPTVELAALEKLDYDGAQPVVVEQIRDNIAYLRDMVAANSRMRALARQQEPSRLMMDTLKPYARKMGERMNPDIGAPEDFRRESGGVLGELMLLYVFSGPSNSKALGDFYPRTQLGDRILTQESAINSWLALEDSKTLKGWLVHAGDRARASRLLQGEWVADNVEDRGAALTFGTNPSSFLNCAGWVEMSKASRRRSGRPGPGDKTSYKWQFTNGIFKMAGIDWAQLAGGPEVWRKMQGGFLSPRIFRVADEEGVEIGTWRRLD